MDFKAAERFIYRNARPLDLARWQFLFEDAGAEGVVRALAAYQNADGGFGHALEADCWSPQSSPVQTWAATQILREIRLWDADHPIVAGILRYLEKTPDFDGHLWPNTLPSNDLYPRAPWWSHAPSGEINYNPTASLTGFILRTADPDSRLYERAVRLLREACDWFRAHCPLESFHTAACFAELFEDMTALGLKLVDMAELEDLLRAQIGHVLTRDTSVWATEYVCKPSLLISSRDSRFYADNRELCEYECCFISQTQLADGSWEPNWDWGCCPEQWHISKNWWKSDIILKNLKFCRSMGGITAPDET